MEHVWILGGLRSHIGVKDGMYRKLPAEVLGAEVLRELIHRFSLREEEIDFIIGGNAVGGGGNLTRLAALTAGISDSVPAVSVDLQCASALESITQGAAKIESGLADLVIAGGMESSSTQPFRMWNPNHPQYRPGATYTVAQFLPDRQDEQVMLEGAEQTALLENISKEEMDFWVLESHRRAAEAERQKILTDIQLSIAGSTRDEGIRPSMRQKLIDRMPFLLPDGKVLTAANTCLMHDGAAFVILCSDRYLKRHERGGTKPDQRAAFSTCPSRPAASAQQGGTSLQPVFRFRSAASIGGDPMLSPRTAVLAARKLLERTALSADEIDAFEVNEAFAVIDALFLQAYPGIENRYNIFGGALAYGHPYGVSGAMLLLHLMKTLESRDGRYGLCSIAAAGGVGSAVLIEREKR